jgi:ribosomal-protein-alanine N-acetyltransferase
MTGGTVSSREDIDRIMTVMTSAFDPAYGEAWTRRQVEDALLIGNCHYLLVAPGGDEPGPNEDPAGFCLSRAGFEEEELLLFAVSPLYRRRGLGWKMLERLTEQARLRGATRLLLEMRDGNPAGSLYLRYGFLPIGRRPDYYRRPCGKRIDAVTFAKAMPKA